MKKAFKPALFLLLMCGVFGVDEVKSVFVMEGDSVTLNPDQTQIQGFLAIEWRFEDQLIASFDGSKTKYPNERFGDRLQLDQTGSLTITNMKTKHSGLYKLQIDLNSGPVHVNFTVTVYESPSVIDAGEYEMKSVSVMSGDRVTLQTGVTQISGDELIVWRFGYEGKLIAKADKEAKSSPLYYDERFRDRLENQTGSLIITNTRTTDSGFYTVKISSSKQTVHKRFSVSVSERGLSSGAVAGIVLVFLAVVAAAGFIYYRRKISELQILTVKEGDVVTLKPNNTIQKGDWIQWMFGDQDILIAQIKGGTVEICNDVLDGRFRDRLKLEKTGSLTITNIKPKHTGLYELYIISSSISRGLLCERFRVSIPLKRVLVTEGESVHLSTDRPKIERDDEIQWMCGDENSLIAEIKGGTGKTHDGADGRFRDRLELNDQTGDLTINDSTAKDEGYYNLKIISSKGNRNWTYSVIFTVKRVSVTEGESVHLFTDRHKIKRDDVIEWRCGEEIIAEIKGGTGKTHDGADGRFRDRLQLNDQTGDLTIKSSTDEDEGDYKLKIRSRKGNTNKIYSVIIKDKPREKSPVKGNNDESVVEMQSLLDE